MTKQEVKDAKNNVRNASIGYVGRGDYRMACDIGGERYYTFTKDADLFKAFYAKRRGYSHPQAYFSAYKYIIKKVTGANFLGYEDFCGI